MTPVVPTENGHVPSTPLPEMYADEQVSIRDLIAILLRRWWLIPIFVAATVGYTLRDQRGDVLTYTAEVMLQLSADRQAVPVPGMQVFLSRETVNSQVEILKSPAVLSRVVDRLVLEVALVDRTRRRDDFFDEVAVLSEVTPGLYSVSSDGSGVMLSVVGPEDERTVLDTDDGDGVLDGPGFRIHVVDGVAFVDPVLIRVELAEDVVVSLRDQVDVELLEETRLLRAMYDHPNPEMAAAVVNELATAFAGFSGDQASESAVLGRTFIANQLSLVADSLGEAQQLLLQYQDSSSTFNPLLEATTVSTQLLDEEGRVRGLVSQERALESLGLSLTGRPGQEESFDRLLALGNDVLPGAPALHGRLQTLEQDRQGLTASRFGLTEQRAEVERLDSLIATTKDEIRNVVAEASDVIVQRRQEAETRLQELQDEERNLPGRATRFASFEQRVGALQRVYDLLVDKYYEAQISAAVATGDVEVVAAAVVPRRPNALNHRFELLVALLIGIGLGVGAGFGLEALDHSVRTAADAEAITGLPVVGRIPEIVSANGQALAASSSPHSAIANEAFLMLRTNLRFTRAEQPRVVLVTSAEPEVGKSTIAFNLAHTLAKQDKVILVDADLRRPSVHKTLGIERSPGLTDVLVGTVKLNDAVRQIDINGVTLSVLTCGSHSPSPSELLGSTAASQLVEHLRQTFGMVVIDAPPILAVTDPSLLSGLVDGTLVVARCNSTQSDALQKGVERLRAVDAPLLGAVLNRLPTGRLSRYYGGEYSYYSDYYTRDDQERLRASDKLKDARRTPV